MKVQFPEQKSHLYFCLAAYGVVLSIYYYMMWFLEKDSFFISASHSLEGSLKGKSLIFSSVVLDSDKLKYTVEVSTVCGTTILDKQDY